MLLVNISLNLFSRSCLSNTSQVDHDCSMKANDVMRTLFNSRISLQHTPHRTRYAQYYYPTSCIASLSGSFSSGASASSLNPNEPASVTRLIAFSLIFCSICLAFSSDCAFWSLSASSRACRFLAEFRFHCTASAHVSTSRRHCRTCS